MHRYVIAGLLTIICMPAMAQPAPNVRAACDKYLLPAYLKASPEAKNGYDIDCGCVTGYLAGRFGANDAEVIVRMFAAASSESQDAMEAVAKELGVDRVRGVFSKVGKFEVLGRELNGACPEKKRP